MNKHIISLSIITLALVSVSCSTAKLPAKTDKAAQVARTPVARSPEVRPANTAAPVAPTITQPEGEWIDWPITSGNWVYRQDERGSIALFGIKGQDALLTLRCAKNERKIYMARAGVPKQGSAMTIRTSHILKQFTARSTGASPSFGTVVINPNDSILDALVYTRGRFAIELQGTLSIAVPAWSEIARVVEDCR